MAEEKLTSVKRFGTRYGTSLKYKFGKIEVEQRRLHKCPYCAQVAAKRVAVGIWQCKKCNAKFAAKAYTITQAGRVQIEDAKKDSKGAALEDFDESYEDEEEQQASQSQDSQESDDSEQRA